MHSDRHTHLPSTAAVPGQAPPWVWALLGLWIVATGVAAAVLAPADALTGAVCRAGAPLVPGARP